MIKDEDIVVIEQPRLSTAERLYIPQIAEGMRTTIRHLFEKKITVQYPEEQRELRVDNYRGVHRLNRDEQGRVACTACFMCSTACPANCIHIEAGEAPWPDREKYPIQFDIDELRCIFCGMCEEACPVDAIELTPVYDLVALTRDQMIFDKEKLLDMYDQTKELKPRKNPRITGYSGTGNREPLDTREEKELPSSAATVVILYVLIALGAVGVYLALPGGRRSARTAGLIFALAAIAGFLVLVAGRLFPEDGPKVAFCTLAAVAVFGAGKVITHPKPVYSALYFILVVLSVACLMVLQAAEFLGIALIIVYAGAILVTYVFVIMLAQQSGASAVDTRARGPLMAVLAGFVIMAAVAGQAAQLPSTEGLPTAGEDIAPALADSNTAQVGFLLLSQYVVALEIAGVLLLVAMIGAIALAKKRVPRDVPVASALPLGETGKSVPPF